jgi:uncharacterized protein (UPF0333 family)
MGLRSFLEEHGQVSIEFILLTGGVVVAALTFYALQGTMRSFADVTSDWVAKERNASIIKLTR